MEFNVVSRKEVLDFLRNRLEIVNAEHLLSKDKPQLLSKITRNWTERIPFTTLKQLSLPTPRACPTPREACDDVMSGLGGLCGTHGVAIYVMLGVLGFECQACIACVNDKEDHICVFVHNLFDDGDNCHVHRRTWPRLPLLHTCQDQRR